MGRVMLDRWAQCQAEIDRIHVFLERLERDGHIEWTSTAHPARLILEYYGIDGAQLERERRELLERQRELIGDVADAGRRRQKRR